MQINIDRNIENIFETYDYFKVNWLWGHCYFKRWERIVLNNEAGLLLN